MAAKMVFTGQDDLSRVIKKIDKNLDDLGRRSIAVAKKIGRIGAGQGFKAMSFGIDMVKKTLVEAGRASLAFATSFVTINDQMEQMRILLETSTGSAAGAKKAFEDIFDFANTAPFSIDSITDSFVKLQTAGLDPMDGTLRTLVDSLAAFGGTSEQLKLVTIAIRQMVGKGVVSMEELRRQLGEQIPTAIKAMAKGLGMDYGEMVKKIETGNLEATSSINAMLKELNNLHGGAGAKRMMSFTGAVTILTNEWKKLLYQIGQTGSFAAITKSIKTVAESMRDYVKSTEGLTTIKNISDSISTFFTDLAGKRGIVDKLISSFGALTDTIFKTVNALLENKEPILNLLNGIMTAVTTILPILSNIVNTVRGISAVSSGDISFIDFMMADAEELKVLLDDVKRKKADIVLQESELQKLLDKRASLEAEKGRFLWGAFGDSSLVMLQIQDIDEKIAEVKSRIEDKKPKIEVDTESAVQSMEDMKNGIIASLEDIENESAKFSQKVADTLIAGYETAQLEAGKRLGEITEEIKKQTDEIEKLSQTFAADINETMRSGMSDEDAWRDQLRVINEFKDKAQEAYDTGNIEKYNEYLKEAYKLTKQLSTAGITKDFDPNELKAAIREFNRVSQITRQGKVAGGRDMYDEALKKVRELQKARKEGSQVAISAEDQLQAKLALQKELQQKIMDSEKEKLASLVDEKTKIETLIDYYDELTKLVDARNTAVKYGGELILNVAGKWYSSLDGVATRINTLTDSVQLLNSELEKAGANTGGETTFPKKSNAKGGFLRAGESSWVGEKGPEIFVPKTSGDVIPNDKIGGTNTVKIDFGLPDGSRATVNATRDSVADFYKKTERYYRRAS